MLFMEMKIHLHLSEDLKCTTCGNDNILIECRIVRFLVYFILKVIKFDYKCILNNRAVKILSFLCILCNHKVNLIVLKFLAVLNAVTQW